MPASLPMAGPPEAKGAAYAAEGPLEVACVFVPTDEDGSVFAKGFKGEVEVFIF